jgi:hypothetical protein
MKLRLQSNTLRLRLKQSEVARFAKIGRVEEEIILGSGTGQRFSYVLEISPVIRSPEASLKGNSVHVVVPAEAAAWWAASDEVAMEGSQPVGDGRELVILIEKDFACVDGTPEQNVDTFPNPLAGKKC